MTLVAATTFGPTALAAPPEKADARPLDVAPIVGKLRSGSESAIREGLDDARLAGPRAKAAAPAIAELLERGLTLALTEAAVATLGDLEADTSGKALAQYAAHREVKVRRAAISALARTRAKEASGVLRRALGDADGVVRATAASGLGALKARDAVPDLFLALDHRVNEAAASIGLLCEPAQCAELAGKLGKVPFDVVTTGLDPVLFRPTKEIRDDAKISIVNLVRALGTGEGNKFLRDVQGRAANDPGMSPRVKLAIDQAVVATSGGSR